MDTNTEKLKEGNKTEFEKDLPNLQCLIDAAITNMANQINGYSLKQCEFVMQLLIQQLITVILEILKSKDSPEKTEEIEQLTALLIMTRVDEVIEILGAMKIFNKIAGINMKVRKGGSYFQQFMKGGFTKAAKKTPKRRNYKKNNNTKRGGAGCNDTCTTNNDCKDDSNCSVCENNKCTGSSFNTDSNGNQLVNVNQLVRENAVVSMQPLNPVSSAVIDIIALHQGVTGATQKSIDFYSNQETNALKKRDAADAEMAKQLKEMETKFNAEFEKILDTNKQILDKYEKREKYPAGIIGAIGSVGAYNLVEKINPLIKLCSSRIITFFLWVLLFGKTLTEYVPFVSTIIGAGDTTCIGEGAFGPVYAARVDIPGNTTSFSYEYTNWFGHGSKYTVINSNVNCTSGDIGPGYVMVPGSCYSNTTNATRVDCQFVEGIEFKGTDSKIYAGMLGLALSAITTYFLIKTVTFQNALLNYETNSIFDWLGNIGKTGWKATGVGFVIDGLRNSAERSELIKMVTNNEIKYEGRLVKKTKYVLEQMNIYKDNEEYKKMQIAIERAQTDLDIVRERTMQFTAAGLTQIGQATNAVLNKSLEFYSIRHGPGNSSQSGNRIENGPGNSSQSGNRIQNGPENGSQSGNQSENKPIILEGGKRKSKNHRKRRKQKSTRKLY